MCHAAVLMSQVCVLPVAVVNVWIQVGTWGGLLTHQRGFTVDTLGRGKVVLFVGVFNGTVPEMSASETFFKPEFQGSEALWFFQSESRYPAIGPLLYTGASKMAAVNSTCGKACSCSSGKTALCVTFPLMHSHCKKKNYLFCLVFFPLICRVCYKNYNLKITNNKIWIFERGDVVWTWY